MIDDDNTTNFTTTTGGINHEMPQEFFFLYFSLVLLVFCGIFSAIWMYSHNFFTWLYKYYDALWCCCDRESSIVSASGSTE
jgi:hypothetical protein